MILIVFCNEGMGVSKVRCIHRNKYDVLTDVSTRTYFHEYVVLTIKNCQGKRIKIIRCIDWKDVDEPCKGDTSSQPRAQALGNNNQYIFLSPFRGGTPNDKYSRRKCRSSSELFLFCMCLPRVSYRALPSFHPGLCRSAVPKGTRN